MYPQQYQQFITSKLQTSKSGRYMEELGQPLSVDFVAKIVGADNLSALSFISERFSAALRWFEGQLMTELGKNQIALATFNSTRTSQQLSKWGAIQSSATSGVGVIVTRDVDAAPASVYYISEIAVLVGVTGSIDIELRHNGLVETYTVSVIAGQEKRVRIDKLLSAASIELVITTPNVQPYDCGVINLGQTVTIQGLANGVVNSVAGYGIRVIGGVQCSVQRIFEQLLPQVAQAVLYKGGAMLLFDCINSQRTNPTTIYADAEQYTKLASIWSAQAQREFATVVANFTNELVAQNSKCLICRPLLHITSIV